MNSWLEGVMIGGMCIVGAGFGLALWQQVLTVRQVGRQKIPLVTARRLGSSVRQDWFYGAGWFGLLLMISSDAVHQVQHGAPAQSIMLSLAGVASSAFVSGVCFGRLLLRRQWRLEAAEESRLDDREH